MKRLRILHHLLPYPSPYVYPCEVLKMDHRVSFSHSDLRRRLYLMMFCFVFYDFSRFFSMPPWMSVAFDAFQRPAKSQKCQTLRWTMNALWSGDGFCCPSIQKKWELERTRNFPPFRGSFFKFTRRVGWDLFPSVNSMRISSFDVMASEIFFPSLAIGSFRSSLLFLFSLFFLFIFGNSLQSIASGIGMGINTTVFSGWRHSSRLRRLLPSTWNWIHGGCESINAIIGMRIGTTNCF